VVQTGQGYASMSAPTKELLSKVVAKRLRHGGHPVLRWMADNLVVRTDASGNQKPDKEKSRQKIDGMVARSWRSIGRPATGTDAADTKTIACSLSGERGRAMGIIWGALLCWAGCHSWHWSLTKLTSYPATRSARCRRCGEQVLRVGLEVR
jgi:hypothetical protein